MHGGPTSTALAGPKSSLAVNQSLSPPSYPECLSPNINDVCGLNPPPLFHLITSRDPTSTALAGPRSSLAVSVTFPPPATAGPQRTAGSTVGNSSTPTHLGKASFSLKSFEWKIACDTANSKAGTALRHRTAISTCAILGLVSCSTTSSSYSGITQ
jgi:hypothetical protein